MGGRSPAQLYALIFGVVLVAVGILGFFYEASFSSGDDAERDAVLGILDVNGWHNLVHIASGVVGLAVAGSYAWVWSWGEGPHWSPITQLGRTSLFIYWIHVELVYGLISRPLHRSLTLFEAAIGYAALCALLLWCSIAKERIARRFARPAQGDVQGVGLSSARAPTRSLRSGE